MELSVQVGSKTYGRRFYGRPRHSPMRIRKYTVTVSTYLDEEQEEEDLAITLDFQNKEDGKRYHRGGTIEIPLSVARRLATFLMAPMKTFGEIRMVFHVHEGDKIEIREGKR